MTKVIYERGDAYNLDSNAREDGVTHRLSPSSLALESRL